MTRPEFLAAFRASLVAAEAEILTSFPHVWPTGPALRVKIRPPWEATVPPIVDPIGLVWYVQRGQLVTILDVMRLGLGLGLSEVEALACVQASDLPLEKLRHVGERIWRTELEAAIEGYRTSREYVWRNR